MSRNWTPVRTLRSDRNDPRVSIYRDLEGYLNKPADERWFDEYDQVVVLVDEETNRVGFKPADEPSDTTYALSREAEGRLGADIFLKPALEALGFEPNSFEETKHLGLEETEDSIVAVDVTPLLEEDGLEDAEESEDVAEEGVEGYQCDECEKTFSTETGRNIHYGQIHDDTDESSEDIDESDGDDEDDGPDVQALVANGVGSVHELAEELDATTGYARRLAMDAGVYNQIDDSPEEEGGYGRVSSDV